MDRPFYVDAVDNVPGLKRLNVSFEANGSNNPAAATVRGNYVASVTRAGTGKFTATMSGGFNRVDFVTAELDDIGSDDGAYATCRIVDETAIPLQIEIFTRAAGGTKTDYSGRRVRLKLECRDMGFE